MRPLILAAVVVLASCASPAPATATPSPSVSSAATPASDTSATRYGVAGLIPPHYPGAQAADYEAMYRSFAETGGAVGVYTNWADAGKEGQAPAIVAQVLAAKERYGFGPVVVALGVARDASGGAASTVDWNGAQRERFLAAVSAVAALKPGYLALGVESNRLFTSDPAAFEGFVKGYADAYDRVKAVSPATKVFTIFQLELMRGGAYLITAKRETPPQWDLIGRFAGRLDLAGFTTYPYLQYATPDALPDDYYTAAAARAGAPLALTEIGWPSADLGGAAAGSEYGGTPEEQRAFVERFFSLTKGARPALALWSFPNDIGAAGPGVFASVSLRANDGAAKPALAVWRAGIASR